jgi:ribonuclease HII
MKNKDRIYQAYNVQNYSGKIDAGYHTKSYGSAIQRDNPEVESVTRINWSSTYLFTIGEKKTHPSGNIVDSNSFRFLVFRY